MSVSCSAAKLQRLDGGGVRLPGLAGSSDVAIGRAEDFGFCVLGDDPVPPRAIDAVELHPLEDVTDPLDLRCRQRDQVRVAVHEADPIAVGHDLNDVSHQERTAPARAGAPEADRGAFEMPAEPNELELVADASAFTRPELDPVGRADDPFAIGLMQEDASIEALCPFDHRRVVVRVGDRDRVDAARAREGVRRLVVEQRDAVPEQAVDEERPLADGKRRLGADPEETRLYLIDDVAMITR